jgi:hypothetical protein
VWSIPDLLTPNGRKSLREVPHIPVLQRLTAETKFERRLPHGVGSAIIAFLQRYSAQETHWPVATFKPNRIERASVEVGRIVWSTQSFEPDIEMKDDYIKNANGGR